MSNFLDSTGLEYFWSKIKKSFGTLYYGQVDDTSTSTVFTAQIDGITEYHDGLAVMLENGVVTSASGFTININSLGAKPVYNSMAKATRETTIFNEAYTMLFVYDSTRVSGGCWICYKGYDGNTNYVPTGYCTTAAATAKKAVTLNYGYRDDPNYWVCVFRYANTAANATISISSYATAELPIYVNGERTSATNTFGAGVILFLYYNNAYWCYNDGRFPVVVDGEVTSLQDAYALKDDIPSNVSELNNDAGYLTSYTETDPTVPDWAKAATKPTYTASEVGALPDTTIIPEDKVFIATYGTTTYADTLEAYNAGKLIFAVWNDSTNGKLIIPLTRKTSSLFQFEGKYLVGRGNHRILYLQSSGWTNTSYYGELVDRSATISSGDSLLIRDVDDNHVMKYSSISFGTDATQYLANDGTWQSVPTVPTKTSDLTNDSGYLTSSDIASVMTYKGTKANYASLPSSDNTIGDVWHLTDTGAEWAWDGSAWQELGTAIDLSNYATKSTTLNGYGITDAKIQNGTITLGSNTITPLTSYTETDPVFNASPAAGITSTDISNWNGKVSDDKTWNGVTLQNGTSLGNSTNFVPCKSDSTTGSGSMYFLPISATPTANYGVKYNSNAYLISTTPSANDNSTKVATTAYVDAAIPTVPTKTSDLTNDSGFSTTDEKVATTVVNDTAEATHYIILGTNSTTASTKLYSDSFYYDIRDGKHILYLGRSSSSNARPGVIKMINSGTTYTSIVPSGNGTITITLPNTTGTLALASDVPKVYSSSNTNGYLTMATLPIYDGSVTG